MLFYNLDSVCQIRRAVPAMPDIHSETRLFRQRSMYGNSANHWQRHVSTNNRPDNKTFSCSNKTTNCESYTCTDCHANKSNALFDVQSVLGNQHSVRF